MTLITASDFPAVRALVRVNLTATQLPDAIIGLDVYQGAGENEVLIRDPLAATRTGANLTRVKNAVCCLVAARLLPAMPQLAAEQFGDYQYDLQKVDIDKRVAQLRELAEQELSEYLESDELVPIPTMFTVVSGKRGL